METSFQELYQGQDTFFTKFTNLCVVKDLSTPAISSNCSRQSMGQSCRRTVCLYTGHEPPALTIVSLYNRYLNRGGEDEVFEAEAELLAAHGIV